MLYTLGLLYTSLCTYLQYLLFSFTHDFRDYDNVQCLIWAWLMWRPSGPARQSLLSSLLPGIMIIRNKKIKKRRQNCKARKQWFFIKTFLKRGRGQFLKCSVSKRWLVILSGDYAAWKNLHAIRRTRQRKAFYSSVSLKTRPSNTQTETQLLFAKSRWATKLCFYLRIINN